MLVASAASVKKAFMSGSAKQSAVTERGSEQQHSSRTMAAAALLASRVLPLWVGKREDIFISCLSLVAC